MKIKIVIHLISLDHKIALLKISTVLIKAIMILTNRNRLAKCILTSAKCL